MAESVVDIGARLRGERAAQEAAAAQASVEQERLRRDMEAVALLGPQLVSLMGQVMERLDRVEACVAKVEASVNATRVRRPVRDELGTILYVVDELEPPVWAQPTTTIPTAGVDDDGASD